MSHLFEEFNENDSEYINLNEVETYNQQRLRERFDSVADRNALEIKLFDPNEPGAYKRIRHTSGEPQIEEDEPRLAEMLRQNMLRSINVSLPVDENDPAFILDRPCANGTHVAIFTITREDNSVVPVYYDKDRDGNIVFIYLISFDKAEETFLHYRDLDEYRSRLQIGLKVGYNAVKNFSLEELKDFSDTYETIQKL